MDEKGYKYDVAFSFLNEDEKIATELNNLLKSRLKTFLYIERQKEVAGTDGEATFNRVFGSEARMVVVLYRENWGKTPWTRIEETAIKNRAYTDGYDFVIFIPREKSPKLPKWLPKNRIYINHDRWGIVETARVIEARAKELGSSSREETAVEFAERIEREKATEAALKHFLNSDEGVSAAKAELEKLLSEVERLCRKISEGGCELKYTKNSNAEEAAIFKENLVLGIEWTQPYRNTLDRSVLSVVLWMKESSLPRGIVNPTVKELKSRCYEFVKTVTGDVGWRESAHNKCFVTSPQLANEGVKMILDKYRKL